MIFDILGVAYDRTQTFRKGASIFPELFWKYLPEIESFQNGVELSEKAFFNNLGTIHPKNFQELVDYTEEKLRACANFPLILGGEHTVTFASAKVLKEKLGIEKIVILDAHPDCENTQGHDGIVRKLIPVFGEENIYLYGIRTLSKNEKEFLDSHKIKVVTDFSELKEIEEKLYLSIDFDIFDPGFLPSVGNPELNGISFSEFEKVISVLAQKVYAIDFVEFTPFGIESLDRVYISLGMSIILKTIAEIIKAKS